MPDITYNVEGSPVLRSFLTARDAAIEGLMGPFGSGKSVGCLMKLVMLAHEMPPMRDGKRRARFAVVRNTYPQLHDTTIQTVMAWLPESQGWGRLYKADHRYVIDGFDGVEIELLFRALDRPDHVQNLLSLEVTGAWCNEAREIPREVIGPLFGRCGRWPPRGETGPYDRHMVLDTNPPDTESWWYKTFEEDKPEGWRLYRQPGGRSPQAENIANLPPRYYEDMAGAMTADECKVYIDAEYGFLQTGRPVYPEYRDDWHCREFEVIRAPVLRCWDFGLTPAAVFVQVAPNGQVRVFDEVCAERAGITAFAPVVSKYTRATYPWAREDKGLLRDVGDPAGDTPSQTDERSCFDLMHAQGIDIQPGVQDVTMRQESVRSLLSGAIDGDPAILVHPRCKLIRKGFAGEYRYRRLLVGGADARYALTPDKNRFSHPHDALQYGCVELVGDRVRGHARRPGDEVQIAALSDFDPFGGIAMTPDVQHAQAFAVPDFDPLRG